MSVLRATTVGAFILFLHFKVLRWQRKVNCCVYLQSPDPGQKVNLVFYRHF